jgi:hypothetical protein
LEEDDEHRLEHIIPLQHTTQHLLTHMIKHLAITLIQ